MNRFRVGILVGALVVAAVAVLLSRGAGNSTPTSDIAVIESFTLLASEGRLTLGPYSRFQWHHPGPAYFYGIAPFYALSGSRTAGLDAGALVLNLAALGVIAWTLFTRASAGLRLTIAAALTLLISRVPALLSSPWNPHVPVLLVAALLVSAGDVMSGAPRRLPIVAVLASVAAQTHVSVLPVALGVGIVAAAMAVIETRRSSADIRRIAATTMGALLVVWTPTLIEQLANSPGNLTLLWNFFLTEPHPGPPVSAALSAWADMMSGPLRPDFYLAQGWLFVESPVRWAEALAVFEVMVLIAAAVRWREPRFDRMLAVLLAFASLLALWSVTRIDREIFDHAVFWIAALGALNLAMLVHAVLRMLVRTVLRQLRGFSIGLPHWPARPVSVAPVFVAALLGLLNLRQAAMRSRTPGVESVAAAAVGDDLQRFLGDRQITRPLIRFDQDAWGMVAGVVLRLQKAEVPIAVEDDWLVMFTPAFQASGREPAQIAIVGKAEHTRLEGRPGNQTIASRDPLYAHLMTP